MITTVCSVVGNGTSTTSVNFLLLQESKVINKNKKEFNKTLFLITDIILDDKPENDYLNNARISVSVSTGGVNVKKIELAFRETTNGLTSDWYLITQIDKTIAGILDNDISLLFNDSTSTEHPNNKSFNDAFERNSGII